MRKKTDEIRAMINTRLREASETTLWGVVKSVDEEKRTCAVQVGGIVYNDVLLYAVIKPDLKGLAFLPAVESNVLVTRIAGSNRLYVSMFSVVDKIAFSFSDTVKGDITAEALHYENEDVTLRIESGKVELSAPETVLNGGGFDGLVKIRELEKNLNSLKLFVETMNTALPSAFTAIGASLQANGATGAGTYSGAMAGQVIVLVDMEDKAVKH